MRTYRIGVDIGGYAASRLAVHRAGEAPATDLEENA